MDLQNITLTDGNNVTAKILTPSGTIQIEAEIMGAGLPVHIDSVTWAETGADASMDISQQLKDLRNIVEGAMNEALA